MKRSRSKKTIVERHFAVRCLQRLGYIPDFEDLVKRIQNEELEFVYRQSCRVTHWKWVDPVNKIACILPYDKNRKQIITVLFENMDGYKYRFSGEKENVGKT